MNWRLSAAIGSTFACYFLSLATACAAQILNFVSLDPDHRLEVKGTLIIPEHAAAKIPAVVIVHATGGIDGTGDFYRAWLNRAGIATLEVDFKTGVFKSSKDRPEPENFVPLGFAALNILRENPLVDPERIGILGFSLGAILAVNSMVDSNIKRWLGSTKGFAAEAALYPDCRYLLRKLNGESLQQAPLIVFFGALDSYGAAEYCPKLEAAMNGRVSPSPRFIMYPDAHHGFDRPGSPVTYDDPWAVNGRGHIELNEKAAEDARSKVVAFFEKWLVNDHQNTP
jgi:uncharacterized protein